MGSMLSMLTNQNIFYYILIFYFVISILYSDSPKKEKSAYLRNDMPSRSRLQNRKRWLESEIQLLHEELAQVSHELEDPIITEHVRAMIRAEVQQQMQGRRGENA
jgi:hypothetical protein